MAQVFLPSDVENDIDKLNIELNTAADTLTQKTSENSGKITRVFNAVYDLVYWLFCLSLNFCIKLDFYAMYLLQAISFNHSCSSDASCISTGSLYV